MLEEFIKHLKMSQNFKIKNKMVQINQGKPGDLKIEIFTATVHN